MALRRMFVILMVAATAFSVAPGLVGNQSSVGLSISPILAEGLSGSAQDMRDHLRFAQNEADDALSSIADATKFAKECDFKNFEDTLRKSEAHISKAGEELSLAHRSYLEVKHADITNPLTSLHIAKEKAETEVHRDLETAKKGLAFALGLMLKCGGLTSAERKQVSDWNTAILTGHPLFPKPTPTPTATPTPTPKPTPTSNPTPAPKPTTTQDPPIDKDPKLQPTQPSPVPKSGNASGVSLPPWAGAGSEIVINVNPNDEPEGGANGVLLVTEDQEGHKKFFQGKGNAGRITLLAGLANGTLRAIELMNELDEHGNPAIGSLCEIGNPPHIEGTQPVAAVPSGKLGIREAASSAQPGDTMTLHIQGNDPLDTHFTLDGHPLTTLSVSNNSARVRFDKSTTFTHHQLVMTSGNQQTQPLSIAVVQLTPHPVPASRPGVVETITVDVTGLSPTDQATMYFELVGDAASIAGGGNTAAVPVVNGKAELVIVGKHAGEVRLRYHLIVTNPQFVVSTF